MKRLTLIVTICAIAAAVAAMPGSAASFNDGAPCPADGPLLVCPTMYVGQVVKLQLLARDGCDVYRWEMVNGGLPAGLSMSASGLVSGVPTAAASTRPWVIVHDLTASEGGPSWCGGDNHSERQFVFNVVGGSGSPPPAPPPPPPALQITTTGLAKATEGTAYSQPLAATGGASLTWTLSAGSLPSGVTLGSNGVLSGTPTAAGSYTFTVRVESGGRSTSKQFELVVVQKLTVTAPPAQTWEVRRPLQIPIEAKGGTPGYSWKVGSTLPAGVGFIGDKGNGSTSFLQGVPGEAGTFTIVLTAIDSAGATADVTVTVTVAPKLRIETIALGRAQVGKRYRLALAFSGGVGTTTWSVAKGSLPSGLTLDAGSGAISGKPRRPGRYVFTLVVTDSLAAKSAMTYALTVARR